jgi:hypothetical protein
MGERERISASCGRPALFKKPFMRPFLTEECFNFLLVGRADVARTIEPYFHEGADIYVEKGLPFDVQKNKQSELPSPRRHLRANGFPDTSNHHYLYRRPGINSWEMMSFKTQGNEEQLKPLG